MLDTILIIIACIIAGIYLIGPIFMNVAGPFIIWKTQKIPAIVKFPLLDNELFINDRNFEFKGYDIDLRNLKFKMVGSSELKEGDEHSFTHSFFRLYWHEQMKLGAMVATIDSNVESYTYLEYSQKYCDGTVLDVMNSASANVFPELEFKKGFCYPKILDAKTLLHTFSTLKNGLRKNVDVADFDIASGFYEVEAYMRKESDALCKKGFLKPEIDENGKRSLTFIGAVQITYKAIAPLKHVFSYLKAMKDNKVLRKFKDQ